MKPGQRRNSIKIALLVMVPLAVLFLSPSVMRLGVPALSPFVGIMSLLTTRTGGALFLCTLPITFLVLWRQRFFCRYLCPMGWLLTTCGKIRPGTPCSYSRIPRLGQWFALLTLGGVFVACPLFLFLDPIILFSASAGAYPHWIYAAGLALTLVLSLVLPGLWCSRLCPLGGLQDILATLKTLAQDRMTPSSTISDNHLGRRTFVGIFGGVALGLLASRTSKGQGNKPLRPPGAVAEHTFTTLCARCGNCVRTCPTNILHPDFMPPTPIGLLAPTVTFDNGYCLDDCARCGEACSTGAIAHLSVAMKNKRPIGLAHINTEACLLTHEIECNICISVCKWKAIVDAFSKETYSVTLRVDKNQCNGCGACIAVCPPRAIVVEAE